MTTIEATKKLAQAWPLVIALAAIVGCSSGYSSGEKLAPVTGTVTVNGKPMAGINVMFEPVESGGASRGTTDDEGKFEVYFTLNEKGAIPGKHHVQFELKGEGVDPNLIPKKYAFGSPGIDAEVKPEGPNDFNFDLTK
ncbi:carboxypeptidase-like regulatory domain-containing protein [Bremerella sp. JC817]|uniref:carboxypeptidase-like regulatory domain-containing protein n=1 Tax=Bremerella sp. JC817 TaxID=3231756 RepID=UPI00345904F6